jgi:hypothetical protein
MDYPSENRYHAWQHQRIEQGRPVRLIQLTKRSFHCCTSHVCVVRRRPPHCARCRPEILMDIKLGLPQIAPPAFARLISGSHPITRLRTYFSDLWRKVRLFTLDFTDPRGAPEAMTKDTSRFADCDTDVVVRLERECLRVFVAVSVPPVVFGSWSALFANLQLLTMVGLHCQVGICTCQAHHAVVDRWFRAVYFSSFRVIAVRTQLCPPGHVPDQPTISAHFVALLQLCVAPCVA